MPTLKHENTVTMFSTPIWVQVNTHSCSDVHWGAVVAVKQRETVSLSKRKRTDKVGVFSIGKLCMFRGQICKLCVFSSTMRVFYGNMGSSESDRRDRLAQSYYCVSSSNHSDTTPRSQNYLLRRSRFHCLSPYKSTARSPRSQDSCHFLKICQESLIFEK